MKGITVVPSRSGGRIYLALNAHGTNLIQQAGPDFSRLNVYPAAKAVTQALYAGKFVAEDIGDGAISVRLSVDGIGELLFIGSGFPSTKRRKVWKAFGLDVQQNQQTVAAANCG